MNAEIIIGKDNETLLNDIITELDRNGISYKKTDALKVQLSTEGTATLIAYLLSFSSITEIISASQYVITVVRNHIDKHSYRPIVIKLGDRHIKVTRVEDLEAAIDAMREISKIK